MRSKKKKNDLCVIYKSFTFVRFLGKVPKDFYKNRISKFRNI